MRVLIAAGLAHGLRPGLFVSKSTGFARVRGAMYGDSFPRKSCLPRRVAVYDDRKRGRQGQGNKRGSEL